MKRSAEFMKLSWMGVIIVGAVLSSGCATVMEAALADRGARSGGGHAMIFEKGPVYAVGGQDVHSLSDPDAWRPSPAGPVGMATRRAPVPGPDDSPLAVRGILGFGVKGLPGADIRKLGMRGYAKNWAESGLGRSVSEISHDPSTVYVYVQLRFFNGGDSRLLLH